MMNVTCLECEHVCNNNGLTGGITNMFVCLPITNELAKPVGHQVIIAYFASVKNTKWVNTVAECLECIFCRAISSRIRFLG